MRKRLNKKVPIIVIGIVVVIGVVIIIVVIIVLVITIVVMVIEIDKLLISTPVHHEEEQHQDHFYHQHRTELGDDKDLLGKIVLRTRAVTKRTAKIGIQS